MSTFFEANGKWIATGEHFVLYDVPAIAFPWKEGILSWIPQEPNQPPCSATLLQELCAFLAQELEVSNYSHSFRVESNIPQQAGLGSSAALVVACFRWLVSLSSLKLTEEEKRECCKKAECLFHGRSSGMDTSVSLLNQPIVFSKGRVVETLDWGNTEHSFFLVNTGEKRNSKQAIEKVQSFQKFQPKRFEEMLRQVYEISQEMLSFFKRHTQDVETMGESMNQNHRLLRELGVSSFLLDSLQKKALQSGALGAKLTGAGMGGCLLVFSPKHRQKEIQTQLLQAGASSVYLPTFKEKNK